MNDDPVGEIPPAHATESKEEDESPPIEEDVPEEQDEESMAGSDPTEPVSRTSTRGQPASQRAWHRLKKKPRKLALYKVARECGAPGLGRFPAIWRAGGPPLQSY